MTWLLDSYAIVEMARGNSNYGRYREDPAVTTILNVSEAFYVFLSEGRTKLAEECLRAFSPTVLPIEPFVVPRAMEFRLRVMGSTGRRFSYADALGYTIALSSGYRFLTGAHEFEGFPEVEFVR